MNTPNPFNKLDAQHPTTAQAQVNTEELPHHEGEPVDVAPPLSDDETNAWLFAMGFI